jgi:hydroxypyruvate reductase
MGSAETARIFVRGRAPARLEARLSEHLHLLHHDSPDPGQEWCELEGSAVRGIANASGRPLTGDLMDRLPRLEVISSLGVGYDMIDVAAAVERGIVVTHTPGVLDADVANYALLLLLAASRDLSLQDSHVRQGRWPVEGPTPLTRTIEGATVGIVGLGRIGRNLAAKLGAFGITVLYHGRRPQPQVAYEFCDDLASMAARADALILCLPGGPETDGMIDAAVLNALGPDGILVNVARGSVVDQLALIAALEEGRLGRAALDVFADEPEVPQALRVLPNVLLSPHAASATVETRTAMFDLTADNLIAWFGRGRVLTPVPECADLVAAR